MKGSYLLGSSYWKEIRLFREATVGHVCEECHERRFGLIGHHVIPREAIKRFAQFADALLGEGTSRGFRDILVSERTCRIRCRSCERSLHLTHHPHGNTEGDHRVMIAGLEEAFERLIRLLGETSRTSLDPETFFAAIVPAAALSNNQVHFH